MDYSPLFQPTSIHHLALKNRLAVAPMTRVTATESGVATDKMVQYYSRFAQGGFGLIITEGSYIDQAYSQTYAYQPGLSDIEQALGWKAVVDEVHAQGARIMAQIQHSGALSQGNRFKTTTLAPSAVQPKGEQMAFYRGSGGYPIPRALTDEEIADVIAAFGTSASLAMQSAGFDGVEIHGANGYLLDQFLTDYTNLRSDQWGGHVAQRLRIYKEVVKSVRAAVGTAVPVGIRISQGKVNDFHHKWAGEEADAEAIFGGLAAMELDFIHVTEFEAWQPAFKAGGESLVSLARRYAPTMNIIANGSLHEPERALGVLADGAEIIALGRGTLSNPAWPNKVMLGQQLDEFDRTILGPIADVKDSELAM